MAQPKVWKMREYFVYFPFFILHDWSKRSAEARSCHCAVLPYLLLLFVRCSEYCLMEEILLSDSDMKAFSFSSNS